MDMYDQQKFKTYSVDPFFSDSLSERPLLAGTVVHTGRQPDPLLDSGMVNGKFADLFPFPITGQVLARGQARFNIFCSPCHGRTGDGQGMIVRRGFPQPPSYYADSVRTLPVGRYFDIMTHGFGRMYSYAERVPVPDRWAIAAYIRALQFSRTVPVRELSRQEQQKLEGK